MDARPIDREQALEVIAEACGLAGRSFEDDLSDQIVSEYLRQTLYLLSGHGRPIHVSQLLSMVRRQVEALLPCSLRTSGEHSLAEQASGILESLTKLGDVAKLRNGYWLPAPLRFILVPGMEQVLIVGGVSTTYLRRYLGHEVVVHGLGRFISRAALPEHICTDPNKWQDFSDWSGEVGGDLLQWTRAYIREARRRFRESASKFLDFEVYVPWLRREAPQYRRWIPFGELRREGVNLSSRPLLCRGGSRSLGGGRRYWLGVVDRDGLREEAPVDRKELRRLQYGLDLLWDAPTEATWVRKKNVLMLWNLLPPEEERILVAVGRDVSDQPGRLPICMKIGSEWNEFINRRLKLLGIRVTVE